MGFVSGVRRDKEERRRGAVDDIPLFQRGSRIS